MKKFFAVLLAVTMILCLAACGAQTEPAQDDPSQDTPAPQINPGPGPVSPMTELSSMEELTEKAGCALVRPEGAEIKDETFSLIAGDPQIAQYAFTADGKPCTLRFANAGIDTDISGIYHDGSKLFDGDTAENSTYQNDEVISQRWFSVDGQYIFTVTTPDEWEWADFDAICSQFRDMEPKNWSGDVPFADYLALTGTYASEDGQSMASVSVRYDHALLTAFTYPDGETMYFWEMDARLKDGKLVYDKETISRRVMDEEKGTAELVPEGEGGEGSVEVLPDGSLDFAGAYSEQLQELVLPRMG